MTNTAEMKLRQKGALRVAIVAGMFSFIVVVLLGVNFSKRRSVAPVDEKQIEAMKLQLREYPDDEQLTEEIRQLDLKVRHDRMRWLVFSGKGVFLLACGLSIMFGSLKFAGAASKTPPCPKGDRTTVAKQVRQAALSRCTVSVVFVVLLAGAFLLAVKPGVEYAMEGAGADIGVQWRVFRGDGSGVSSFVNVPVSFGEGGGGVVLWKSPIPLAGMNSPVVWDEYVFVSGGDENNREIYCYNALSGEMLWTGKVPFAGVADEDNAEPVEETGYAAPTLAVDGKRVYGVFATGDIAAFDFSGKEVWSKSLGWPDNMYGYASSLAMHGNLVLIQYDQGAVEDGKSKVIALDGFSGQVVWQKNRPVGGSWASPIVAEIEGVSQLITCADPFVISYDAATGDQLWLADCLSGDVAPSSIYAGGFVFAVEPYNALVAIRPGGTGDVTKTHIAWKAEDDIPDICSPVSDGELIWLLNTEGGLICYEVASGQQVWLHEFDDMFQASPSLVGDKLMLISEEGVVVIVKAGREFVEIGRSELGEACFATPAFAEGKVYIRGVENLYCIGGGQ